MSLRAALALVAATVVGLSTAGCREDVTAVLGTDIQYSLYGLLTPQEDTQWVRVFPVEDRLRAAEDISLDVVVRSTDLTTGETRVWSDTTMISTDRMLGYFYYAPFRGEYGHKYRIELVGADGDIVSADATVPERVEIVQIVEDEGSVIERVLLQGPEKHFINVQVDFDVAFGPVVEAETHFTARYDRSFRDDAQGSMLLIDLAQAQDIMEDMLKRASLWSPTFGVRLDDMTLRLVVADPQWDPPDDEVVFDPLVLIEPGTMSNVEGGFGFVAAGYALRSTWRPKEETLINAGFRVWNE